MNKSKIIGLSLISTLFLFSFVNISQAAPPDYVGVSKGSTYTWVGSADMANVNATAISLIGQENWTISYNMIDEMVWNQTGYTYHIDDFLGVAFKLQVTNVTDEMLIPLPSPHPAFPGAAVYGIFSATYEPGVWMPLTNDTYPMAMLLDPVNINESNFMYWMGFGGPPLLLPKDFPFLTVTPWLSAAMSGMDPVYDNITYSGLSNGMNITILAEYLEWGFNQSNSTFPVPTFSDINILVTWNEIGVMNLVSVSYMGLTLGTFQLIPGEEEIPGFIIPVFLGVSAATIVGVISIIRRKKFVT